jgi:acyl-CoA thioesterase-1
MRPFLFVLLICFSSLSFAQKKLIVLGDSLTEGYGVAKDAAFPAVLEKKIA